MLTRQVQDGYLDEWQQRAARYALRVSRSVVLILSLSRRAAASKSEVACELRPAKMNHKAPFRALSRFSRLS